MKNTPAVKESNLPVLDMSEWDVGSQHLGQDIVIPKILPMQGQSQLVTDMKAQVGEFRDSVSGAKLGSIAEPFEIIPFHVDKVWDILVEKTSDKGEKQFEYERSEPIIENPMQPGYNDNLEWTGEEDGTPIKRVRRMNFYCLLPGEIASGGAIPYVMSFKSTSFREGKKMFSQMYLRNLKAKLPPPAFAFKLAGIKAKNDRGQTYIVPTVELGRRTTEAEIAECLEWYKTIKGKKPGVTAVVDDSDLKQQAAHQFGSDDEGTGDY